MTWLRVDKSFVPLQRVAEKKTAHKKQFAEIKGYF
jgi:hypothetical protein